MWCPVLGLLVIVIFPGHARKTIVPRYDCDREPHTFTNEGNQGPVGLFPWLGVIRVTLNEGAKLRIAVTGAVLIRITFAIANAEDIAKIPNPILRKDTKAMFISSEDMPWLYAIRRYIAAPDFRKRTMSSIALVELLLQNDPTPLMPICWQDKYYHLSHKHIAVGFTDERYILEKIAYNMLFVNKTLCETYYEKIDVRISLGIVYFWHKKKLSNSYYLMLGSKMYVPAQYECWAAMNNSRNCLWENGMILVSNYTGTWFLIGIGTQGPGCSLPVRFISVLPYVEWIESVINEAFKRINSEKISPRVKEVPAHKFFPSEYEDEDDNDEIQEFEGIKFRKAFNPQRKDSKLPPRHNDYDTKPDYDGVASDYDVPSGRRASAHRRMYATVSPYYATTELEVLTPLQREGYGYNEGHWKRDDIRHMDPNVIQFTKFGNMYERSRGDCTKAGHLVYKEVVDVSHTPNVVGYAYYKLSLIELEIYRYTCILIRVKSRTRSDCNLWYSIAHFLEEPLWMLDDTPWRIIKYYIPVGERSTAAPFEKDETYWTPTQRNVPPIVKEQHYLIYWHRNRTTLNLYLKFDFDKDAQLILEVWSRTEFVNRTSYFTKPPFLIRNNTRSRLRYHSFTRSTKSTAKRTTRKKKKRTKTKRRRRPKRSPPPSQSNVDNLTAKSGYLTAKSGSNGCNYVESGLFLILVLFISAFG